MQYEKKEKEKERDRETSMLDYNEAIFYLCSTLGIDEMQYKACSVDANGQIGPTICKAGIKLKDVFVWLRCDITLESFDYLHLGCIVLPKSNYGLEWYIEDHSFSKAMLCLMLAARSFSPIEWQGQPFCIGNPFFGKTCLAECKSIEEFKLRIDMECPGGIAEKTHAFFKDRGLI